MKRISQLFMSVTFIVIASCTYGLAIEPPSNLAVGSTILIKPYLTNSPIHIPAGHFSAPYTISQSNTEYILDGDIVADSTAFYIQADYVALNLNGYTITYNNVAPGAGVWINVYSVNDVAIHNGTISQGAAASEGGAYGLGSNPIRTQSGMYPEGSGNIEADNVQIADMTINYNGLDTGGIYLTGTGHLVENTTTNDLWGYGEFKNRHHLLAAIRAQGDSTVRNCTVNNARQIGIRGTTSGFECYGNTINILSKATNSTAIAPDGNALIYNNTIYGRGEHPIGIYLSGNVTQGEVYGNTIDLQSTYVSAEYGFAEALGIRATSTITGGADGWVVHDNDITITSNMNYSEALSSVTGLPYGSNMESQGKAVALGLQAGETLHFYNNKVTMMDEDGTATLSASIVLTSNESSNLLIYNNTVTSNLTNARIADDYNPCTGYPLFKNNTFIKAGNFANYHTIDRGLNGYYTGEARFVDNIYQNGAAESSRNLYPGTSETNPHLSIYFGTEVDGVDRYYMQIHDNGGSSSSEIQVDYDPMITLPY